MPERKRYHHSYIAELKSVTRLEDMFAKTEQIIPHINRGDREPGEDGSIIVLAESEPVSYGRLVVQVKKLSDEHLDPPKENIELSGLYHYLAEDAPFLLIGVDLENDLAYWHHIDDAFIQEEVDPSRTTKTIEFDTDKKISYDSHGYVDEFRDILQETREIYATEQVAEVRDAVHDLQEMGHQERAIRQLKLELDDATRALLRTRGIPYGPFDKLRGKLQFHDITSQPQNKIYRTITSLSADQIEDCTATEIERIITDGLELLEYLCEAQRR